MVPPAPPLPTPPPQDIQRTATPPPRVSSPRNGNRVKKSKKNSNDHPSLPVGLLNGAVPPINVLIVEDNIINLKLLEAFVKRLKIRWQTAMNGKEAVTKWRVGGFHLVLMDIQLPVMNGLEATREIRRLEKLNSIGVFSSSASSSAPERATEPEGDDKLPNTALFKSPVIIVALTASSLQSDRHEALAAGCNDFLTKVSFLLSHECFSAKELANFYSR
jgi:osomolarity two-component system response regulator SSK1